MSLQVLPISARQPNWLPMTDLAFTALAVVLWLAPPFLPPLGGGIGGAGAWPLLLAIVPWVLRLWQTGRLTFMTSLAGPLSLFMLTAVVALWAAYNPTAAWAKFWMLVAAMFLFYSLANQPPTQLWFIAKLLSLLTVIIAGHFLLTHNWQAEPTHVALLDGLAERWMGIRPAQALPKWPFLTSLHPNQAAGFIIVLAPFGLAVAWYEWGKWPIYGRVLTAIAAALVLFALLLTASRGAWLALTAAVALWGWSPLSRHLAHLTHHSPPRIFRLGLGLAFMIILAVPLLFPALLLNLANRLPGAATASSRAVIFSNTLHLLADFPFTGGGLNAFPGLYSQYMLVIPQRVFTYAHNLFLDVTLEQGILGLLTLVAMLLGSLWLLSQSLDQPKVPVYTGTGIDQLSLLRWAVTIGLVAMIGHGLVDDAFYGNRGTPLLWLLPGLAVAISRATTNQVLTRRPGWQWSIVTLMLLLAVATIPVYTGILRPQWRAAWLANLAALQMARVELAHWPTDEWADGRYLPTLQPAEQRFQQALQTDPTNRTAHHRLGLIAMLRRDFETAITHLEAARLPSVSLIGGDERRGHPGIHKSLAYSYLWAGHLDQAQTLLATIPEAQHELAVYTWWWATQERDDLGHRAEQMLNSLRLNPQSRYP